MGCHWTEVSWYRGAATQAVVALSSSIPRAVSALYIFTMSFLGDIPDATLCTDCRKVVSSKTFIRMLEVALDRHNSAWGRSIGYSQFYTRTRPSILASIRTGCEWCSTICDFNGNLLHGDPAYFQSNLQDAGGEYMAEQLIEKPHSLDSLCVVLAQRLWRPSNNGYEYTQKSARLLLFPDRVASQNTSSLALSTSNTIERKVSMSRTWLQACVRSHRACEHRGHARPFRPTRLVRVLGDRVQLVLSRGQGIKDQKPYLALSYCWGNSQDFVLKKSNQSDFYRRIPSTSLAQVVKDAINLTTRLGYQYIWIDSLCILQDSEEDWLHESKSMLDVYRNALCVIAAESSTDAQSGSLFATSQSSSDFVSILRPKGEAKEKDTTLLVNHAAFYANMHDTALSKRAWAVQELLIPSRIVHIAEKEWFWTCQCSSASESFLQGLPRNFVKYLDEQDTGQDMARLNRRLKKLAMSTGLEQNQLFETWSNIVSNYSTKHLTCKGDRLVALLGIAQSLENATKCKYTAGLWLGDSPDQLLWYPEQSEIHKDKNSLAPSWSWACVDGEVNTRYWSTGRSDDHSIDTPLSRNSLARIIGSYCYELKHNVLGMRTRGFVHLSAYIAKVMIPRHARGKTVYIHDCGITGSMIPADAHFNCGDLLTDTVMDSNALADKLSIILPLIQEQFVSAHVTDQKVYGLILYKASEGEDAGRWKRGGMFTCVDPDASNLLKVMKQASDGFGQTTESAGLEWEIVDGSKKFLLEIW